MNKQAGVIHLKEVYFLLKWISLLDEDKRAISK